MQTIIMTDKEKIIKYLEIKGITKNKFYKDTGLSVGFLDSGNSLGVDKLKRIADNYHDFNYDHLITGRGDVLKELKSESVYSMGNVTNTESVPLYDLSATASVVQIFSDPNTMIPTEHLYIPGIPTCDGAIHVTGDSMYPLLKSGDIVAYKMLNNKRNIVWGEMYLVYINDEGDEFFFVKYIQQSEREGYVKLVSQNEHHAPVEFHIDSLKQVAHIKASIRINSRI